MQTTVDDLERARRFAERTLAAVERAEARVDSLSTELEAARAALKEAHSARSRALSELIRLERAPADAARLADLSTRLKTRLSRAPVHSPTARRVREHLEHLEADRQLTVADQLEAVKRLAREASRLDQRDYEHYDRRTPPNREHRLSAD